MIRRKDLVVVGGADYKERQDEFMQCQDCGGDMGGTQGDFFMMSMGDVFRCPECESENIAIVRRVEKIVVVKK